MAILIAGVDEVGRGPLAGPVIASAVILKNIPPDLNDSKKLTEKKRTYLNEWICSEALSWSLGRAEAEEIDQLNIHQATLLAMKRALDGLSILPEKILVDGKFKPKTNLPCQAIIKGDESVAQISAASIVAKVARDKEMIEMAQIYPGYGFECHKGYGTPQHLKALATLGPCPIHRKSFAPVTKWLYSATFDVVE